MILRIVPEDDCPVCHSDEHLVATSPCVMCLTCYRLAAEMFDGQMANPDQAKVLRERRTRQMA